MAGYLNFPKQALPFTKKTKEWRKSCVQWASNRTFYVFEPVRNSVIHKKINYDLVNGKLHMRDLELIVNPEHSEASFIPDKIQHYPIMNSKLNVLKGEEAKRVFDYRVIVTNPGSVSSIEETKKQLVVQQIQQLIQSESKSEDEFNQKLEKMSDYFAFEWKDMREMRANYLLNHYSKEQNFALIFNEGFSDAYTCGEEIYKIDIISGEPVMERLNPLKLRIFKSGYSNNIEDADVIIYEDYWSPGKVIDTYYDVLSKKDIQYIEETPDNVTEGSIDTAGNIDERFGFLPVDMIPDFFPANSEFFSAFGMGADGATYTTQLPYDLAGNIRVLQVYWKSKRRIKKVKSYDPETGEETYNFYPETYQADKSMGEEETNMYINEAWEGTMIGKDIFVNMRPRIVQYNRLSNPSRCHFGIVGTIYNLNESKPFSLVDMMKPYNYLYDIIHDRLNKTIASNWGEMLTLDMAKKPEHWEIDKWMYYAKVNHLMVIDSFREGNKGASTGKLSGMMSSSAAPMLSSNLGNYIQQNLSLLEYIKGEMGDVAGINRQREGQISNRETVGGVERATLQSSLITEWIFFKHDDTKRRALECFIETAKIALKGRSKKFQYILPDSSQMIMDIDGDEFAENDYGLVVDNGNGTQLLNSKLETLAQAALQNQTLDFSAIMKLYNSCSLAEKERIVQRNEESRRQAQQQESQQQAQQQQELIASEEKKHQEEMDLKDRMNLRDNETKLEIARLNAGIQQNKLDMENPENDGVAEPDFQNENKKAELMEKMRQFDAKMSLEKDKLNSQNNKASMDNANNQRQLDIAEKQAKANQNKPTSKSK